MLIKDISRIYRFFTNDENWTRYPEDTDHFLAYKLYGSTEHMYAGKVYSFTKNSIMLVNQSDLYSVTKHEKELSAGRGSCIAIHFSTIDEANFHFSMHHCDDNSHIKSLFFKIMDAWNHYTETRRESQKLICFSLLYELLAVYIRLDEESPEEYDRIRTGKEYLERNYSDSTLSIEHAAYHINMSSRRFSELFRTQYNQTPSKYLTKIRMENAMKLLEHSKLNSAEIAKLTGYEESSYFIRVFHKEIGLTPVQYRLLKKK